jgi:hypothetical protein
MPCYAAWSGAASREQDMWAIGELWSLSVAGPFTTGSVQMTEAEWSQRLQEFLTTL